MKKILSSLIIIAVLMGAFVYYYLFIAPTLEVKERLDNDEQGLVPAMADDESAGFTEELGRGTLGYLQSLGFDLECSVKHVTDGGASEAEGSYFVSGSKVRADFVTISPDMPLPALSSMIMVEDLLYVWSEIEGVSYGVKMPRSTIEETANNSNTPISMTEEVDYDCQPWVAVDDSVFIPPTEVLFKDVTEIIQAGMEYGTVYEGE